MSEEAVKTTQQPPTEAEAAPGRDSTEARGAPKLSQEEAQAVLRALDPFWTRGIVPEPDGPADGAAAD